MDSNQLRKKTTRFLIISFAFLAVFSVVVFSLMGIFVSSKSTEALYELGELYMTGMSEQLSNHFETTIHQRLRQMEGLKMVVRTEDMNDDELYDELTYRGSVRDFDYLALCSEEGEFEMVYGDMLTVKNLPPFLEALNNGENRVALGRDTAGNDVVLFGVSASYPMKDGKNCTGLVAALPIGYITETLSLEEDREDTLIYSHIIRPDGSFVIQNCNMEMSSFFESVQELYQADSAGEAFPEVIPQASELYAALKNSSKFSSLLELDGEKRQIYGVALPDSEWYLVMVMPYGMMDKVVSDLTNQRTWGTLGACAAVLVVLIAIFIRYFSLSKMQIQELEKARHEAVQATKAKSEFLSNMSHDIRTPMNAIVGMTAIAQSHLEDREHVENCLRKISLSSKHLLGLINDVLDMSKIESGRMTLAIDRVSLNEVMEEIVSITQPQIRTKKQSFDVHTDNITAEYVYCDGVRLNQVLLNLLSNAVKYTPEGGSILLALAEKESPKGEGYVRLCLKVKDNGIGMSPEFVKRVYESYSRADNARVHKTEGAGLGMAITKYIIDAMGGTIEVESELDKGTEFRVTLDLEKAEVTEMEMKMPPWRMLVVDDDETLCRTTASALESIGVRPEWTLSGESAIEMAVQRHNAEDDYKIILLDWKLPGMSGIQVAAELRSQLGDSIPILLISAYDWSEFETEAREAGINGFLSKPLFKSTLYHGLSSYMGVSQEPSVSEEPKVHMEGRRVLLAEDNELNCEIANELLKEIGIEAEWAENGQICLKMFQGSLPGYYDAILMDIRMPEMNGYEATKAIRALSRPDAQTIPIIAMTADAFSEDIQQCLDCGMNAHIAKPVNLAEITRLLNKYFQ
ncbi:response regulator [uncultured Neglectibacter sp.]|uniref:response regulator n=1 Tax=uncultured Neglectibacter sp. TaxID=1924108 RepID=UPI0034DFA727